MDVAELVALVEGGRPAASRELAGSVRRPAGAAGAVAAAAPGDDLLWRQWRRCGYRVHLGTRAAGAAAGEVHVDEALHSAIAARLLDDALADAGQTLVLLTGDGNNLVAGTANFPQLAGAAARHGWAVEVWAWRRSCSHAFAAVRARFPDRVRLCFLDAHRDAITFEY